MLDTIQERQLKKSLESLRNTFHLTLKQSYELAALVLGFHAMETPFHLDQTVSQEHFLMLESLAARIASGEPLAHVMGCVDFYGCKIFVDSRVLIPRVETEFLVEKLLKKFPENTSLNVLDLCTGSGCIGIALKKHRPQWSVYLSDISKDALAVAEWNGRINEVDIEVFHGDLFEPLSNRKSFFDVIVCNPPYIAEKEYLTLEPSVFNFEPKLALSPGFTGLEIYERIAEQACLFLKPQGSLALEIGYNQKEEVKKIFSNGFYKNIICEKDLALHDRFIFLELQ
jgi:release factor glutamine methyltransferase